MILVLPEGSGRELLPDASLKCEDSRARTIESNLRMRICGFEYFQDDTVVEKNWYVPKSIAGSGWGLKEQWTPSPEAQELAPVSPEHHAEFILQYEKRILEPFGLTGYGCCEDLTRKLDDVFMIPHIRRISISSWSDVDICSAKLKGDYIFSWKPNPTHLVGEFNPESIRKIH